MSRNFLTSVNLNGNALAGATIENLTADPSGILGRLYFKANASSGATSGSLFVKDLSGAYGQVLSSNLVSDFVISSTSSTITVAKVPTNPNDVVNKAYADGIASGVNAHDAVSWASTANISGTYATASAGVGDTLSGTGSLIIDTHTIVSGDVGTNVQNGTAVRVLLKDQTATDQNGIYAVTACVNGTSWTLTRAYDYDTVGEVSAGDITYVNGNTGTNAKYTFVQTNKVTAITGTTANPIAFSVFANGNLSGTVLPSQGGTGTTATPTDGQLLIGNSLTSKYVAATLGTSNTTITTGNGTLTIGIPQSVATSATPQFGGLGIGLSAPSAGISVTGGKTTVSTSAAGYASFNIPASGTVPTLGSYVIGDLWVSGTALTFATAASVAKVVAWNDLSNITSPTNNSLSLGTGSLTATAVTATAVTATTVTATTATISGTDSAASLVVTGLTSGNYMVAGGTGAVTATASIPFSGISATTATATSNTTAAAITASYSVTQKLSVTFTQPAVSPVSTFTISHALGRFVHVQVTDSTGLQVECDITNTATGTGQTTITFATAPATSTVYYVTIIG
jgi:hypothetical protein